MGLLKFVMMFFGDAPDAYARLSGIKEIDTVELSSHGVPRLSKSLAVLSSGVFCYTITCFKAWTTVGRIFNTVNFSQYEAAVSRSLGLEIPSRSFSQFQFRDTD